MQEQALERRLKRETEKHGGQVLKFIVPGKRGVPDRIILLPGARVVFTEIKASGETPSPIQRKRMARLMALGFPVYCLDSVQAIDQFIAEVFGCDS